MSDSERILLDLSEHLSLLRIIAIFINIFSVAQLIVAIVLPDIISTLLKTWLIVIAVGALIGVTAGLIISKKDPKTSQFFIFFSVFLSGLTTGISFVIAIHAGRS